MSGRKQRDTFIIGSHLDTVINAGRFDGPLGFLLGLGVVELLRASQIELPFDLDVVGFSEEEGVRYRFPFIGSRGIIGTFDPADLDRIDDDGIRMGDALQSFGCDVDAIKSASYLAPESPRRWKPLIGQSESSRPLPGKRVRRLCWQALPAMRARCRTTSGLIRWPRRRS